ncbi:MAG: hypothetical protein CME56_02620 [Halieaceae bacterium]|nr:hypothetical protein [Halieaceae bacterium]
MPRSGWQVREVNWLIRHHRLLAAALLSTFILSQMPARVLTTFLPATLTLSGLSGSVWSGQAVRAWTMIDGKPLMLGRVQWQLQPWRLCWGSPLTLTSEWGDQIFTSRIGMGLSGLTVLRDVSVNFDTSVLREMFPLYLGGTLSGSFERIEVEQAGLRQAQGTVYLQNAIWTANSGDIPLGDYRIDVAGNAGSADGIVGEVVTENGALVLVGDLNLSMGAYAVKLSATGPVARDDGFRRAVSMLATPTAEGFDIVLQGQL